MIVTISVAATVPTSSLCVCVCMQVMSNNVSCAETLPQHDCVSQTLKKKKRTKEFNHLSGLWLSRLVPYGFHNLTWYLTNGMMDWWNLENERLDIFLTDILIFFFDWSHMPGTLCVSLAFERITQVLFVHSWCEMRFMYLLDPSWTCPPWSDLLSNHMWATFTVQERLFAPVLTASLTSRLFIYCGVLNQTSTRGNYFSRLFILFCRQKSFGKIDFFFFSKAVTVKGGLRP